MQKRIVRIITDSNFHEHRTPLFHQLNLLKLADIYTFYVAIFMFRKLQVAPQGSRHSLYTRNRNLVRPDYQRLSQTQNSLTYIGPTLWILLRETVTSQQTSHSFKKMKKIFNFILCELRVIGCTIRSPKHHVSY